MPHEEAKRTDWEHQIVMTREEILMMKEEGDYVFKIKYIVVCFIYVFIR